MVLCFAAANNELDEKRGRPSGAAMCGGGAKANEGVTNTNAKPEEEDVIAAAAAKRSAIAADASFNLVDIDDNDDIEDAVEMRRVLCCSTSLILA